MLLNGAAVRVLRERLGLSQTSFAVRAGINRSHLSNIERNRRPVSPEVAEQLRVHLKLKTLDAILAETGAVIRVATRSPSGELSDESSPRRALSSDQIATDTK